MTSLRANVDCPQLFGAPLEGDRFKGASSSKDGTSQMSVDSGIGLCDPTKERHMSVDSSTRDSGLCVDSPEAADYVGDGGGEGAAGRHRAFAREAGGGDDVNMSTVEASVVTSACASVDSVDEDRATSGGATSRSVDVDVENKDDALGTGEATSACVGADGRVRMSGRTDVDGKNVRMSVDSGRGVGGCRWTAR